MIDLEKDQALCDRMAEIESLPYGEMRKFTHEEWWGPRKLLDGILEAAELLPEYIAEVRRLRDQGKVACELFDELKKAQSEITKLRDWQKRAMEFLEICQFHTDEQEKELAQLIEEAI